MFNEKQNTYIVSVISPQTINEGKNYPILGDMEVTTVTKIIATTINMDTNWYHTTPDMIYWAGENIISVIYSCQKCIPESNHCDVSDKPNWRHYTNWLACSLKISQCQETDWGTCSILKEKKRDITKMLDLILNIGGEGIAINDASGELMKFEYGLQIT